MRTILDTDIGTDVDDCLALAFILGSPELSLEGITCVYGDVQLRGRMIRRLLALRGVEAMPLRLGASQPLLGLRPIYWGGHEGKGLTDDAPDGGSFDREHAVDYIVRTVMANPGEIHLLSIGPMTNVALALLKEPALAQNLAHLWIMAGAARGIDRLDLPVAEHNVACDPEAAHVVLSCGAPMTLVPLDVTTVCSIRRPDVARLRAVGDPFHDAVAEQVDRYPRFAERGETALHDPLCAAVMVRPDLVELVPAHVGVETTGRLATGATVMRAPSEQHPETARVALRVESAAAEAFIGERLLR